MKFQIHPWMPGNKPQIEELKVFAEYRVDPAMLDIPDEKVGEVLVELSKSFDVMLVEYESSDWDNVGEKRTHRIHLDDKGKRFRQR